MSIYSGSRISFIVLGCFFFSSRRRHTRWPRDWSSDVCSSDLGLIAGGMVVQAIGIWLTVLVPEYSAWLVGAVLQGTGTAMVYPTLLAAIADHAHPLWRASSLGVYRFWRDLGYAIGALLSGVIADALSVGAAIHVVAAITLASGLVTLAMMRESRP